MGVSRSDASRFLIRDVWPWIAALGLAALPAVLAQFADTTDDWIPVYVAGGLGGVMMELFLTRSQLEMPTYVARPPAAADDDLSEDEGQFANPTGPRVDMGFLGRFFAGGLIAVVFIILGAVVIEDQALQTIQGEADSNLTLGWAIAIGSAAPAVWTAIKRIVDARVGSVRRQYEKDLAATKKELEKEKKNLKALLVQGKKKQTENKQKTDSEKRARQQQLQKVRDLAGRHLRVPRDALRNKLTTSYLVEPGQVDMAELPTIVESALDELSQEDPTIVILEDHAADDTEPLDELVSALEVLETADSM